MLGMVLSLFFQCYPVEAGWVDALDSLRRLDFLRW